MFLRELFYFNRILFVSFLSFIVLFIFLNIKWGVVAYPINQYGMYAGKYHVKDTQQVYLIYVNEKPLSFSKLAMAERDVLQYSLDFYKNEKINNASVFVQMKGVLNKLLIGSLMKESNYTNAVDSGQFSNWFKNKVEQITGAAVTHLDIYTQQYAWRNNGLEAVTAPLKYLSIVSYK